MIAPRFGLEPRRTIGGDPVSERALLPLERAAGRFRVVPLVVPASVDQQTHGISFPRFRFPWRSPAMEPRRGPPTSAVQLRCDLRDMAALEAGAFQFVGAGLARA